jgi:SulP family sulfate permease
MDQVPLIDQSGLYTLEDIVFDLEQLGTQVLLVNLQKQPMDKLRSIDIIPDLVAEEHLLQVSESLRLYKEDKYIRIKYVRY